MFEETYPQRMHKSLRIYHIPCKAKVFPSLNPPYIKIYQKNCAITNKTKQTTWDLQEKVKLTQKIGTTEETITISLVFLLKHIFHGC